MELLYKKGRNVAVQTNPVPKPQTPYHKTFYMSNQYGLYPIYPHLSSIKTYKKSPKISKNPIQMF